MDRMMNLWNPAFNVSRILSDMERLISESNGADRLLSRGFGFRPLVDVYEIDDQIVVKALLPCVDAENLDVTIEQNTLSLRGRFGYELSEDGARKATWYRREIGSGQFAESLTLPVPIDPDQIEASFSDGVLTLTMPKAQEARTRKIPVQPAKALTG